MVVTTRGVTLAGLRQLLGLDVTWQPEGGIRFDCRIIDARTAWNRVDVLIQPHAGSGQRWVSAASVKGISDKSQAVLKLV